jgi:hypothetical protein
VGPVIGSARPATSALSRETWIWAAPFAVNAQGGHGQLATDITAQGALAVDRSTMSGDFYLATTGDLEPATTGDFPMATDTGLGPAAMCESKTGWTLFADGPVVHGLRASEGVKADRFSCSEPSVEAPVQARPSPQ